MIAAQETARDLQQEVAAGRQIERRNGGWRRVTAIRSPRLSDLIDARGGGGTPLFPRRSSGRNANKHAAVVLSTFRFLPELLI